MKTVGTTRTNTKTKIKFQTGIRKERNRKNRKENKNNMSIGEYQIPITTNGEDKNWNQQAEVVETGNFKFEDLAFEEQSHKEVSEDAAKRAHDLRLKLEEAKLASRKIIEKRKNMTFGSKIKNIFTRLAS